MSETHFFSKLIFFNVQLITPECRGVTLIVTKDLKAIMSLSNKENPMKLMTIIAALAFSFTVNAAEPTAPTAAAPTAPAASAPTAHSTEMKKDDSTMAKKAKKAKKHHKGDKAEGEMKH